jgi:hypothetical protein
VTLVLALLAIYLSVAVICLLGLNRRVNWFVYFAGQVMWVYETAHFGWNWSAKSDAEFLADLICMAVIAMSFMKEAA